MTDENTMSVKNLERCFGEKIDEEMSKVVDTVDDRIQKGIWTEKHRNITAKVKLVFRSINASSVQDPTSVMGAQNVGNLLG